MPRREECDTYGCGTLVLKNAVQRRVQHNIGLLLSHW